MLKDQSLWTVMQAGGLVMYVLILCSILSITVMIERFIFYRKKSRFKRTVFMEILNQEFPVQILY